MVAIGIKLPPVDTPLVHDTEDQVAKDGLHKQDLRQEFEPDKSLALVIDVVKDVQADSKGHVNDTNHDGLLHLVRVGEEQEVFRAMPCGIKAESVDVAVG